MKKVLAAVLIALAVSPVFALDKDAFALHLRKALSLDTRAEIKIVSDPVPAGVGDLKMVTATVGGAPYPVYLTPDEKKYIWGFLVDATVDPDKTNADKISLKNVHAKGSATAPVTLVEFSDLQCSHCKAAHETLKRELPKVYPGDKVRVVFKHFPLSGHDWAEPAATAAECAAAQKPDAFWDMIDYFFSNQDKVKKDNVRAKSLEAAGQLGLKADVLGKCLDAGVAVERVRADKKEGSAVGVSSTPSIFINGRNRRGFRDIEDIKVVVEEKLKEKK